MRRLRPFRSSTTTSRAARRGSVLVMVAFMLVSLMAVGAIAADIGRFYVVANELQTAADAATLLGARTMQWTTGATLKDSVDAVVLPFASTANRADGQPPIVSSQSIRMAYYTPKLGTDTATFDFNLAGRRPNALEVSVSAAPTGVFSRFIGETSGLSTTRKARAWVANASANCVLPMTFPYTALFTQSSAAPSGATAPELDPVNFASYITKPASQRMFIMLGPGSTGPMPNQGNWLPFTFGAPNAEAEFRLAIHVCTFSASASADTGKVAPGPSTQYIPWATESFTGSASGSGSVSTGPLCVFKTADAGCYSSPFSGTPGVSASVVWSDGPGTPGSDLDFRFTGEFIVACYFRGFSGETCLDPSQPGTGAVLSGYPEGTIVGLLAGIRSRKFEKDATLSNTPSNVQRIVLVN